MKKILIIVLAFALTVYSLYASAAMSCSIIQASECNAPNARVLRMSDLAEGGSHASIPNNATPTFPLAVCCSGVSGLEATSSEPGQVMGCLSSSLDGHVNQTGSISTFGPGGTCLNLTASTSGLDCEYAASCPDPYTCLFSISGKADAHVSGCKTTPNEYPFDEKFCCKAGGGCSIDGLYWGVYDEVAEEINALAPPEPLGPVGGDMSVFLIAETSGCSDGTFADFTIYKDDPVELFNDSSSLQNISLGTFEGEPLGAGYEGVVLAAWLEAGVKNNDLPLAGEYYFETRVYKDTMELTAESLNMEVRTDCGSDLENVCGYFSESCGGAGEPDCLCGGTGQIACCGTTCPVGCPSGKDEDCDGVDDCLDDFLATVADPSTVDPCSGVERGTAGCIPAMDCTNLDWSDECKNCEAGQPCAEPETGINPGDQYMERCWEGSGDETCQCEWVEPYTLDDPPPGCTNAVLDQSNNRFKACIEEEEFPVFTGFNVIAVLAILSIYYAVIIVRKKRY